MKRDCDEVVGQRTAADRIRTGGYSVKLTLPALVAMMTLALPFPARASLGGDAASVRADQTRLRGALRSTNNGLYTVQELTMPSGVVVREYLSANGRVFGVSWRGPSRPDLRQVLGTYFDAFDAASRAKHAARVVRGPMAIRQANLIVEMGGHMRWLVGRAYLTDMIPPDVRTEEIR